MKKTYYILFILIMFGFQSQAQSLIGNNLYTFNPFSLHPAYAGHTGDLEAILQAKTRNMRVGENYVGSLLSVNGKVNENVGLGANIVTNQQGIFENLTLSTASSYTTKIAENHQLSFGIGLGITRYSINTNTFDPNQFVDVVDPFLMNGAINQSVMSINAGFVYKWKELQVAVSSPSLFQQENGVRETITSTTQYTFKAENVSVTPSMLVRFYSINPTELTANVRVDFKDMIWTQVGYRNNSSLLFGAGLRINEINLGYSYGVAFGDYNNLATGGHEIVLGINFKSVKGGE